MLSLRVPSDAIEHEDQLHNHCITGHQYALLMLSEGSHIVDSTKLFIEEHVS